MEENNIISIQCPKCKKKNAIALSKPVECSNCKTILTQKKKAGGVAIIVAALVIGLGSGHLMDDAFEKNRYPINVEYSLIDSCVSFNEEPLSYKNYYRKKDICECALLKTQEEFNYYQYKQEENEFMKTFTRYASKCIYK
ncbi:MAG: hypothetical protein ACQESJ_08395 [Bacteroidota bacterium]